MKYSISLGDKIASVEFDEMMNTDDLFLVQEMLDRAIDNRMKELKRNNANQLQLTDSFRDMFPPLTGRTENILRRAGYETIGDVLGCTITELERCRNMGKKSMDEIKERFSKYGNFKEQESV